MDSASLELAGWKKVPHNAKDFGQSIGPFWWRGAGTERVMGFVAEPRHCNGHLGTVHGGVLMTFADAALGTSVAIGTGGSPCATAQLQLDFVSAGQVGDFVICQPEVIRRGAQLVFIRGLIRAGDRTIASANGIWKIFEPRKAPA